MDIVHIITRMILGGAMENTLLTCEGLHRRGHRVTLITGPAVGPEGELVTRARAGGYEVVVLDELRREICLRREWIVYRRLQQLLAERQPQIVHTHASKAGILGRRAARRVRALGGPHAGMRIVHTVHGLAFGPSAGIVENLVYRTLERRAAAYTDAFVSVADAMTRQALAAGVGRAEQYTTIYSGMETDLYLNRPDGVEAFRQRLGLSPQDILVTQVARLAPLKGYNFILDAAMRLDDPRIHFCFVGDGTHRRAIEAIIQDRGLQHRMHLTGMVSPAEVAVILHASQMLVHCSLREGLARALPQAMLAGLPVISWDIDGAAEVVNSDTGILLEPRDVAGLKLAIETLAGAPDLRAKLGAEGRRRAQARFDHHVMVDRIEALYRRLTGSP